MFILAILLNENAHAVDHYVLSDGGGISIYTHNDKQVVKFHDLLDRSKWSGIIYPIWVPSRSSIMFEARHSIDAVAIYEVDVKQLRVNSEPKKLVAGRLPSLSPDGHNLSYFAKNKNFIVTPYPFQTTTLTITDVNETYRPLVWLDNNHLVYFDMDKKITVLDISNRTSRKISVGTIKIIPISVLPNTMTVLCINYDANSLFLLNTQNNQLIPLITLTGLSIGSSIVWRPDGKSFFYTRQTWWNLLKLSESFSLFTFSLNGETHQLIDKFALFGGFFINQTLAALASRGL